MLIPETVQSIGVDVFKDVIDARSAGYAPFCIVTPRGSTAATYARKHAIPCVEMPYSTLAEHSDAYISLLLFSRDYSNHSFGCFDPDWGILCGDSVYQAYLAEELSIGNGISALFDRDTLMLALNNLDMAFYKLLDWFIIPGDGDTYMADVYADELEQVLSQMTGISTLQLDTATLTDPVKMFTKDEAWESLDKWLREAGYSDNPVTKAFSRYKHDINQFVDSVEEYTYVTNFILHCLTDYSQSIYMLELLQNLAEESTDQTFVFAVNQLEQKYDTELDGMIVKAIDEMLMPALTGIADAAVLEWAVTVQFAGENTLGGVLSLYTLARKAIDISLKVSGSADFRSKQLSYIAMLEICHQAQRLYRVAFTNCDSSPEALQKLQLLWEFNCCACIHIYNALEQLYTSEEDKTEVAQRKESYLQQLRYTYSFYSSAMMNQSEAFGSGMVVEFIATPEEPPQEMGLKARWYNATTSMTDSMHEAWYEEVGYESVEAEVFRYVDDVPLGRLASWYFWEDDSEVDALAVFDQFMLYHFTDPDDPLWQLYSFGWISSVRLEQSELYQYEKWLEDEEYVSEYLDEYYLFRITMVTEDGYPIPFEILILEHASSEGEEYGQYMLLPNDALTASVRSNGQAEPTAASLSHEESACIQQYEAYLNSSETTYANAVVADFDLDGMPEVMARYSVGRWGSDCHILDIVNGHITVHEVHATFSNGGALTLYQLPNGELRWLTFHSEAAQGERHEGMAQICCNDRNEYSIPFWYHYSYRSPDLSNPGITYYIGQGYQAVTEQAYFHEVAVHETSVPLDSISINKMTYPDRWAEAINSYVNSPIRK